MIAYLKRIFKVNRYFIVFYQDVTSYGEISKGYTTLTTSRGLYLNNPELIIYLDKQAILKAKLNLSNDDKIIDASYIILNIIELSRIDYKTWTAKNTQNQK